MTARPTASALSYRCPAGIAVLLAGLSLWACAAPAWQRHVSAFDVDGSCPTCVPARGQVRSDQFTGSLADTTYALTNAVIRLQSGDLIEAGRIRLNGATGLFVTDSFTGRIGAGVIEVQAPGDARMSLFSRGDGASHGGETVIHDGRVGSGHTQITAAEIRLRQF